jgi:hypothetical protein
LNFKDPDAGFFLSKTPDPGYRGSSNPIDDKSKNNHQWNFASDLGLSSSLK